MNKVATILTLLLAWPLALRGAVHAGEPVPLSQPLYGAAPGYHGRPMVASDGEDFLAVWLDQRPGPDFTWGIGARIQGADGALLDPLGIMLPAEARALTYGAGQYAAAASPFFGVSPAGAVTRGDAQPLLINAVVAASGSRFLVINGYDQLQGWFIDAGGRVVGDVFTLPTDDGFAFTIVPNALVATPGGFVLLYTHGAALLSLALDPDGRPVGQARLLEASATIDSSGPAMRAAGLASAGGQLLAAWSRLPEWTVVTQRLDPAGAPLGPQNDLHVTGARNPKLVAVNDSYVLFHGAGTTINALPLASDGSPSGDAVVIARCAGGELDAASNGRRACIVWQGADGGSGILAALVDASGHPVTAGDCSSRIISRSAHGQRFVALASSGDAHAAAWIEEGGAAASSYAVAFREWRGDSPPSGDAEELGTVNVATAPSIALGPRGSFVTWDMNARVSESGIASAPFVLGAGAWTPASVASSGDRYVVVWFDSLGLQGDVYSSSGTPLARLDRTLPFSTVLAPPPLSLACTDDLCVAVWMNAVNKGCRGYGCFSENVVAARIAPDGRVLDGTPIPLWSAFGAASEGHVSIASDGRDFVVAWIDEERRVHAAHLSREGRAGATVDAIVAERAASPAIAWNGSMYVLAWQDITNYGRNDVVAALVDRNGAACASTFAIADADLSDGGPSLAAAPGGVIAGYSGIAFGEYGGVWRGFVRKVTTVPRSRAIGRVP